MIRGRLATVCCLVLVLPAAAAATTAESLSDRIVIDGRTAEVAGDEWVLDATTSFPESDRDSRWGFDRELVRLAVTWDATYLYIAADFLARDESLLVLLESGTPGIATLDGAGELRRSLDFPGLRANVVVLARPGSDPYLAHADATHSLTLVDDARAPARVTATVDGRASLEAAIPWDLLSVRDGIRMVAAITHDTGSGTGDAAPDPRAALSARENERARLDRRLFLRADANDDGTPDAGVSPRLIARVEPDTTNVQARGDIEVVATVDRAVIAPDRGEEATFTVRAPSGAMSQAEGTCRIHSLDGRRVRTLPVAVVGPAQVFSIVWDGRDERGRIEPGGVFVAVFDLEIGIAGARARVREKVGVAVVR